MTSHNAANRAVTLAAGIVLGVAAGMPLGMVLSDHDEPLTAPMPPAVATTDDSGADEYIARMTDMVNGVSTDPAPATATTWVELMLPAEARP